MSPCIVWVLLLASAVQGVTPDARDLCSPLAIRWLLAIPPDADATRRGDDQADEVCLAFGRESPQQGDLRPDAPRFASPGWIVAAPADASSANGLGIGAPGPRVPGPDLLADICRLNC